MIVTFGRRDGVSSLPFAQLPASFIARKTKARNMFVDEYRMAVRLSTESFNAPFER